MAATRNSDSDYKHFASIPWCAKHLTGSTVARTPASRLPKPNDEDSLFAGTLKTQATITAMLELFEEPPSPSERVNHVKAFLTLGSGVNGYPGVCHGGLVMTVFDEVIALFLHIYQERGTIPKESGAMTAYLNTTFMRPVLTPSTILAQAHMVKLDGRKLLATSTIEDKDGVVLAKAEALFIVQKSKL